MEKRMKIKQLDDNTIMPDGRTAKEWKQDIKLVKMINIQLEIIEEIKAHLGVIEKKYKIQHKIIKNLLKEKNNASTHRRRTCHNARKQID